MMTADYQAGPALDVDVQPHGDQWTLVFVRELKHPPARVWRALTDPAELSEWAPFDADRDLGRTGQATLSMVGGPEPMPMSAEVRRAEQPRVLEYTWGKAVLHWELEPIASGTRLTLRQTLDDRTWLPKVAAGWHMCLDVADRFLSGAPIGRIVAHDARRHGWERLNAEYATQMGITDTGWPERLAN